MENFNLPNRHSIRLKNYDYSSTGYYHVTICSYDRKNIFGDVKEHRVELSVCGQLVKAEWLKLKLAYKNIALDEFIIMPNHIHGIIMLKYKSNPTLGDIICRYKSITTRKYNKMNHTNGNVIWQLNYHDQIMRNEQHLYATQKYIMQNPLNWDKDDNYNI